MKPSVENQYLATHATLLYDSYHRQTGRLLIADVEEIGAALYFAEFALLSSDLNPDPLFNYANETAHVLFEMSWEQLVRTPARESAEPDRQQAREILMNQVKRDGYIDGYSGVRISTSGRRFTIKNATVWNVVDSAGALHGQAAMFREWEFLE